jgi:hypothetical protein
VTTFADTPKSVSWTCESGEQQFVKHETGKGDEVEPGDRLRQPLLVFRQPPEPGRSGERALEHPPPRQQHKAPLGLLQLDHLQPDAVVGDVERRVRAGAAWST